MYRVAFSALKSVNVYEVFKFSCIDITIHRAAFELKNVISNSQSRKDKARAKVFSFGGL